MGLKWSILVALVMLFTIARAQVKSLGNYAKAISVMAEVIGADDNGNKKNVEKQVTEVAEGMILTIKLSVKRSTSSEKYLREDIPIEIIHGRITTGIFRRKFSGIDEVNRSNVFTEINEIAQSGDRIVIDLNHREVISIPIVGRGVLGFWTIVDEALDHNVYYGGADIEMDGFNGSKFINPGGTKVQFDDRNRLIVPNFIRLDNCRFIYPVKFNGVKANEVEFDSLVFSEFVITGSSSANFVFKDCSFKRLNLRGISGTSMKIVRSDIGDLSFQGEYDNVTVVGNKFREEIDKNSFEMGGLFQSLAFNNNQFESVEFDLNGLTVEDKFKMLGNFLSHSSSISMEDLNFPTSSSEIEWRQFAGHKFSVSAESIQSDGGEDLDSAPMNRKVGSDSPLADVVFTRKIRAYQKLVNHYREIGDINSANECYVEKKDLEGLRLKAVYVESGRFRDYVSWRLNSLMKFYTEHGTDPAKAIVISGWVILCFGIFYFFYPSDWDKSSKAILIRNFKDLVEKNEKGYWKPLLVLIGGISFSLLNAITLSLNSFVTLGFGNIPTHGAARYVTIVEGFVGWLLLSIFTVALINQTLA